MSKLRTQLMIHCTSSTQLLYDKHIISAQIHYTTTLQREEN